MFFSLFEIESHEILQKLGANSKHSTINDAEYQISLLLLSYFLLRETIKYRTCSKIWII